VGKGPAKNPKKKGPKTLTGVLIKNYREEGKKKITRKGCLSRRRKGKHCLETLFPQSGIAILRFLKGLWDSSSGQ